MVLAASAFGGGPATTGWPLILSRLKTLLGTGDVPPLGPGTGHEVAAE